MNPRQPVEFNRRQVLSATAAAVAAPALLPATAWAQDKLPSHPITLIAPWPAGGSSDGVMRAFAESASKSLDVPVIIENKPGAGGTMGAAAMANARPDGYTLTQVPLGIYRLPRMQNMSFDLVKDISQKVLHDAFRRTLEDPAVQAMLDKLYMPSIYMITADYTAYGVRTFKAEKAKIERLRLAKKN